MLYTSILMLLEAIALFFTATVIFDVIHFILHLCLKSKRTWLHKIGSLHLPHHRFFNTKLKILSEYTKSNLLAHVVFENITQLIVILCGLFIVPVSAVVIAVLFQLFLFILVCKNRGIDPHHKSYEFLPAYKGGWWVSANYHALHHHYVTNYYSSYIKILDFIFGTAHHLAGKNIVMTGANGALGSNLKKLLEAEGAVVTTFKYHVDYDYGHYEKLIPTLKTAHILLLCHGSKFDKAQEANCDSYVAIIELYKQVREKSLLPPEVWATGSEIECHPCFGIEKIKIYAASKRNYAKHAWQYYRDDTMQYRHLVHSAFMSKMGPGLMTASFAAKATLFLIKRGCRYVPVTYTGFGLLNYFRFLLGR